MSTICFKRHHLFSTTNIQSIAYGKGIRHHFKKMLLILMDKWYHSLPTAGNCRQSPLRLSNPEPWFMRIGCFLMGMNFTGFPNGQDSWLTWCKTVFWAICANKPSSWIFRPPWGLGGAPPHGHRVHRPKARGQDSDGQSHSAASCSNVAPEKPIFSKAKKPAPFSEKKKTAHFSPRQPCPRSYLPKSWLNY